MADQLPINPAVLAWARQRAGLSLDETAEKFARIAEWEAGEAFPTYPQLEKLADAFKIPIAVFFFPQPPDVPEINETFRTLPEAELALLPSRIRLLMRKAKVMQMNLAELTQGQNPSERLITRDLEFPTNVKISDMAAQVRDYLGVSLEEQQTWDGVETAQKAWRAALLQAGIFVFKDAFRSDGFSGFCLYDNEFPIIYVNNSSTKTRQIFTYFHELAHLMFHTSGIDKVRDGYIDRLVGDDRQIEILCNSFAAEFLIPTEAFELVAQNHDASEASAEAIAAQFGVSREVIFRKFLDLGRIDGQAYDAAVAKWNEQRQAGGGGTGGNHYWTKLSYLGRDYVELALSQFHQNKINESQLADYLDTKPKNVGTLEDYFSRGAA